MFTGTKILTSVLMIFGTHSAFAHDAEALAATDFFKFFAGTYQVVKRTCRAGDSICASVDSVEVVSKDGEPARLLEFSNGKLLDQTIPNVYGDVSSGQSYGMIYGTPTEIAGWKETLKNSDKKVTEENNAGIRAQSNPDENGPVFIYLFSKGHNTYDPSTGKVLSHSLRDYQLVRNGEQ